MDNINNEHRLIVELQTGSRTAFKAIYDMYAERLYSFVFSYLHSRSEAEDIVQDVFVRLWQSREQIRRTESLKSLLFVISRNRIVSEYRKRVNEPAFSDYMACRDAAADGCGDGELEYNEFVERLHAALRRLPPRHGCAVN